MKEKGEKKEKRNIKNQRLNEKQWIIRKNNTKNKKRDICVILCRLRLIDR